MCYVVSVNKCVTFSRIINFEIKLDDDIYKKEKYFKFSRILFKFYFIFGSQQKKVFKSLR